MAVEESSNELDEEADKSRLENGRCSGTLPQGAEESADEEEEEEEEPRLKYAPLTKHLSSLYRNGDASSAFLVAGDKMVVGTHSGNLHVLSLPTFQPLRVYHAHSASVSAVSISPFPPPLPSARSEIVQKLANEAPGTPKKPQSPSGSNAGKTSPQQPPVPNIPSNAIYVATSSIDGHVCVSSLVDPNDVQLRNFGRPIQSVALSPEYKNDRCYISGGQAGSLILTTGGQIGRSANATTTGAAAAASGWLGSIGLGANTGTDKVLHSGEGIISSVKWSLSGRYVLWVNEQGIKFMRSNLKLDSADAGFEWKRLSHTPRPSRTAWEDMAGVWKARLEWVDRDNLETDQDSLQGLTEVEAINGKLSGIPRPASKDRIEEAVVGWGDTVWLFRIHPSTAGTGKDVGERKPARVEVVTILRTDCIISGVSLYTQSLLLVLAYIEGEEPKKTSETPTKKGRSHRQTALQPELRLIDVNTQEEIITDTLAVSRFESLSASDYHLGILPPSKIPSAMLQRGALGALGAGLETIGSGIGSGIGTIGSGLYTGVETVGQGVWDVTLHPTRLFALNRQSSSADSIRSGQSAEAKTTGARAFSGMLTGWIPGFTSQAKEVNDVATIQSTKVFIFSPYDCIVAVKRNLADRLQWLLKMERYQQAWQLLDEHPEAAGTTSEASEVSSPPTPSNASSTTTGPAGQPNMVTGLAEFFTDASSISSPSKGKGTNSAAEKEKRRIGELWLQQLVSAKDWDTAGEVAGKVLNTTPRWEHWIWAFVRNQRFDEIAPVVPTFQLTPPLSSSIYEIILGHYVSSNRARFKELIDEWPSDIFDIGSITNAIEDQLRIDAPTGSSDWRFLQECLAKLHLADGRYGDALRCYIHLQDADAALAMIKDYHLLGAVADDIAGLVTLRVPPEQLRTVPAATLEELTSEPLKLLVDEVSSGVVEPEPVVVQLQSLNPLLVFFFLRALWRGEGIASQKRGRTRIGYLEASEKLAAQEGKSIVEQFADTAVEMFAEFDRDLLMDFLHTSTAYAFEKAVHVCERREFIPELVYLLSKTGQTRKALFLIIDELKDVVQAISFVREQNDDDLWEDLFEYSMSRPKFISGLLAEVGTAINPITLVKRIPSGLEIEGLKDGLKKMIRGYDLQDSISTGVAKVLQGELAVVMDDLRRNRRRGIKFDITAGGKRAGSRKDDTPGVAVEAERLIKPGHCAGCHEAFVPDERETLVGFACGHAYHLSHLLNTPDPDTTPNQQKEQDDNDDSPPPATFERTVGPKVTKARLLRDRIAAAGRCKICEAQRAKERDV